MHHIYINFYYGPGEQIVDISMMGLPFTMEYREQASPISSHTYDHARTSNTLPTTMPGRLMQYLRQNIGQQHT